MDVIDNRPLRWASLMSVLVLGCSPSIKVGDLDTDSSSGEPTETSGTSMTGTPGDPSGTATEGDPIVDDIPSPEVDPSEVRKMDILLVVDNSGSMGGRQARLVEAVSQVTAVLDSPGIAVDWRLGITTTDNGNPWCQGTTPEGGALVASSCRSRLNDFVFQGQVEIDATAQACTDVCELEALPLEATAIPEDPELKVRPWISGSCDANIELGILQQSIRCAVPQGINGCGFEQPLESMRKAIVRAQTPTEDAYGFIRPDAHLVVLIVTDEADCSSNSEQESAFLPDGERTYWNPDWASPSSALCWRAGVDCSGDPDAMACQSANKDVFGQPTTDPDAMVIHPMSRYQEILSDVRASKTPGAGVFVLGAVGLASGGSGPVYTDVTDVDPLQMENFGVGPGCEGTDGVAVPPVRMLELFDSYPAPAGGSASICDADYGDAVVAITSIVGAGIIPSDQVCP